jgi:hypothetical protein
MRKKLVRNFIITAVVTVPVILYQITKQIVSKKQATKPKSEPQAPSKRIVIWPKEDEPSFINEAELETGLPDDILPSSEETVQSEDVQDAVVQGTVVQSTVVQSTNAQSDESYRYIASSLRQKFHTPSCRWALNIAEENRIYLTDREIAITEGYVACGTCKP